MGGIKRYRVTLVDGLGRVVRTIENYENGSVTAADGTDRDLITSVRYDRAGRQLATTDALGRITRVRYNGRDQVLKVTENADGICNLDSSDCNLVTRYQYDRMGNRTATIDARNILQRRTTYDAADWPRVERDPLDNEQRWTYHSNRLGLPLTYWTGKETRTYAYDARGLLTSVLVPGGRQEFRYDALGRRTVMGDHLIGQSDPVTVTTRYDALSRITSATQQVSGVNETLRYGRDAVGRQTSLSYPSGYVISYGYSSRHELKTVNDGSFTPLASYTYDPDGWLSALDMATTTTASAMHLGRWHDAAGRLTTLNYFQPELDIAALLMVDYQLNRGGERTQKAVTNDWSQTTTENTTYDGVGRLAATTSPGGSGMANDYDAVGNRTASHSVGGGSYPLTLYNAANQRRYGTTYPYDGAGQQTSSAQGTYTYDGFGRLMRVVVVSGGNTTTTTQRYAADGTLVRSTTSSSLSTATTTVRLVQDWAAGLPRVLETTSATSDGGFTTLELPIATIYGVERLWSVTGSGSKLQHTWYLPDGLGSPLAQVNKAGTVIANQAYTPWGTAAQASTSPFGFTGEWQGDASALGGLVYLRARWYNPIDGTFLSRDPFPGYATMPYSQHPYQYGYSNPATNTDPSGRDPWWTDPNDPSANCTNPRVEYGVIQADECDQKQCHYDDFVDNPGDGDVHCNISVAGGNIILLSAIASYLCLEFLFPATVESACADGDCENEAEQIIAPILKGPIPDQVPSNMAQQLALEEAKSGMGEEIMRNLGDKERLIANYGVGEWVKFQYIHRGLDGTKVVVHWFVNLTSGLHVEFKFK